MLELLITQINKIISTTTTFLFIIWVYLTFLLLLQVGNWLIHFIIMDLFTSNLNPKCFICWIYLSKFYFFEYYISHLCENFFYIICCLCTSLKKLNSTFSCKQLPLTKWDLSPIINYLYSYSKSPLFPTNIIYNLGFPFYFTSSIHLATLSKLSLLVMS